jgi:hypothetical protein
MKEYHFNTNDTAAYYKLIGLCVLCSFLIVILWITLILTTGWSIPYALIIAIVIPVVGYYFFRKRAANTGTATLSPTHAEFKIKGVTQKVMFTDITSYSADRMQSKGKTIVSLRIRLKDGKKLRYYGTSDICDIEPLALLCRDFDILAKELAIESKFMSW